MKENVASILRLFAKDLLPERLKDTVLPSEPNADANATRPSGQTGNKNDMAVQTTQVDALVLVNGHNELRSRSQSQVPRDTNVNADSVLARPFPEGEEALRAEVAILSAKIVEQQSSIRSLEQVAINLRETNAALYAQQEEHLKQIREAEARENSQAFERANIKANLDRAAQEVQTLRTEIRNFHQPASRLYKSIKDAVLREMRGEGKY